MNERYSKLAVALHWLIALGIIFNLWVGNAFDRMEKGNPVYLRGAIDMHKSVGITVLGLVLMRVLWRFAHRPPAPLEGLTPVERKLSVGVHHLLYALMVLVPLAGWLHDSAWKDAASHPLTLYQHIPFFRLPLFGGMDAEAKEHMHKLLGAVHGLSSKLLLLVLVLHVAAALKHQFLGKKPIFRRMWF